MTKRSVSQLHGRHCPRHRPEHCQTGLRREWQGRFCSGQHEGWLCFHCPFLSAFSGTGFCRAWQPCLSLLRQSRQHWQRRGGWPGQTPCLHALSDPARCRSCADCHCVQARRPLPHSLPRMRICSRRCQTCLCLPRLCLPCFCLLSLCLPHSWPGCPLCAGQFGLTEELWKLWTAWTHWAHRMWWVQSGQPAHPALSTQALPVLARAHRTWPHRVWAHWQKTQSQVRQGVRPRLLVCSGIRAARMSGPPPCTVSAVCPAPVARSLTSPASRSATLSVSLSAPVCLPGSGP